MKFETQYDVVIAGGGVAGAAAALSCARQGLRTALLEKTVLVGGLATTGLVNGYLPLCDGEGHQVITGIAEELLHLSLKYGPGEVPEGWREPRASHPTGRYMTIFSPASFVLALDEALVEAGVDLWFDTLVSEPVLKGRRIVGVEVENKSGRGIVGAGCVIDATGDADVAYRAGAVCETGENWLSLWAFETSYARMQEAVAKPTAQKMLGGVRVGADAFGQGHPSGAPMFEGIDGAAVSQFVLEGRRLLREYYADIYAADGEDRHRRFPITLPSMAQFRTTRRIVGHATLVDGGAGVRREDSVGLSPDWRRAGPIWEIPYGALVPQNVTGMLAVGRCISSDGDAWEVTRVIPPAALTGEVAGIAAALALRTGKTPDQISPATLQTALSERGIPFHIDQVRDGQH
jgi:choline dehydrogenase-like flavoprotein